jgi:hypothetical protein
MTYVICGCSGCGGNCTKAMEAELMELRQVKGETLELIQKLDKEPNAMKRAKIMAEYLTRKHK